MIQASLVDTWAATSAGAYAMTENNLYTVEAFEEHLRHLKPDGVLTITRWYAGRPAADVARARRRRARSGGEVSPTACSPRATDAWRRSF